MLYSINLVTLSDSPKTEAGKIAGLAEYLATFQRTIADGSQELYECFDALLADIRTQTDYLAALRAAQPLVEAAVRHGIELLEENNNLITRFAADIKTNIETDFAINLGFKKSLKELEEAVLEGLALIHRFYLTADPTTLATLAEHLVPLYQIVEGVPPTLSDVPRIQDDLIALLGKIHQIREYQGPEFDEWQAVNKELDRIYAIVLEDNSRAALALIVWGQAYQKMVSGVKNPAEWFSLGDLLKIGGKAIEKAL